MQGSPLVDIALGYMPAQALGAAARLGLADLLGSGPRSSGELAAETATHGPSLLRLLRVLVALGVVAQTEPDRFALTDVGTDLRSDVPGSVRSFVVMVCEPESWLPWGELGTSLRTGEPVLGDILGVPLFEHLARHPEKAALFNEAMSQITRRVAPGVVAGYDFGRFGTLVDVGGGDGTLLAQVLRSAPGLRGVLFDLPAGVAAAPPVLEAAGVGDRCRTVGGDFFASVPGGADAYLVKSVLHDWPDDRAVAILRNCREAMAPGGRVLVVDRMVPELVGPEDLEALVVDLYMLVSPGGRERTEQEYRVLCAAAGLEVTGIVGPLPPYRDHIVEAAAA
jgi:SAM-dependent methyltransferase